MRLLRMMGGLLVVAAVVGPAQAQKAQVDINPGATLRDGFFKKNSSVGWYFTPSSSFFLSMISTEFHAGGANLNRTVMAELWSDRPAAGGTMIRQAGFQSNTAIGGFGGAGFAPVLLQAGVQYFIGFRNVMGLGYNYTPDPFATSLGSLYYSHGPTFADDPFERVFDEKSANPTLQLVGTNLSAVPEPMTMTLLATGLGGLGLVSLIRRRRGGGTPS